MRKFILSALVSIISIFGVINMATAENTKSAIFAGGCFWCMEEPFASIDGVESVKPGYTGGQTDNPTYESVIKGGTGHVEAVEIKYDPAKVDYKQLLEIYWENVDPLDATGQFCDQGEQYRTAVFYHDEAQKQKAEESLTKKEEMLKAKIVTMILPAEPFYEAEEYHQNYYKKNPLRYQLYKQGCGRDQKLKEIWENKDKE